MKKVIGLFAFYEYLRNSTDIALTNSHNARAMLYHYLSGQFKARFHQLAVTPNLDFDTNSNSYKISAHIASESDFFTTTQSINIEMHLMLSSAHLALHTAKQENDVFTITEQVNETSFTITNSLTIQSQLDINTISNQSQSDM